MDNKYPSYYSILTAKVRYARDIKANEKLLLSDIAALANKNGYCTATNNYFSKLYGKSKTTISKWINHLKERGYLKVFLEKDGVQIVGRKLYPVDNSVDNSAKAKDTQKAQKPIEEKQAEDQDFEIEFEKLWSIYPKKLGKKEALKYYEIWRKSNKTNTYKLMLNKLNNYLKYLKIKRKPLKYTLQGSTWFGGRYDDELDMTHHKSQFNQQVKPIRKATNWDKVKQQQPQTIPQITRAERDAIFREYGSLSLQRV